MANVNVSVLRNAAHRPALRWTAAVLVLFGLVAVTWVVRRAAVPPATNDPAMVAFSDAPQSDVQLDTMVAGLQTQLSQNPNDARSYVLLGAAYLQKVRDTADPAYYGKADLVLHKALSLQPADADTLTELGVLALARHQFAEGLDYGQMAHALNPYSPRALGVIFDGQTELGEYDTAAQTIQLMVNTRPDMSSYSRVSYARELHGDVAGALQAMRMAAQAGSGVAENTAWTYLQVGNLLWAHGDLAGAGAQYEASLRTLPNYVPAEAGLAQVLAAQGDLKGAEADYEKVVSLMPLSQYVIALGDAYTADGNTALAKRNYDLVSVLSQLQVANGVDVDLEITVFEADHPGRLEALTDTLSRARQLYSRRPTLYAADALAWTLYQSGSFAEARTYSDKALSLNTQDALLWFHAGMIAAQLGDATTARYDLHQSLNINPHFSLLWAPVASQKLAELSAQ